ncbi:MAG: tetratricopeptide repeat protein [Polyangia bacterium]
MRSSWAQGLLLVLLCTGRAAAGEAAIGAADEPTVGRGDACLTDRTCQDLYKRARALSRTGQLDAAAVLYREAYKRREAAWLLLNLGRVLQRQGKLEEAVATYELYLRTSRPEQQARINKAREYLAMAQEQLRARPPAPLPEPPAAAAEPPVAGEPPPEIELEPPPAPLTAQPAVRPSPPSPSPPAAQPARWNAGAQHRESGWRQRLDRGFFIGVGVTGALLAAAAVTGGLALSGSAQLQRARYIGGPGAELQDLQGRTRGLAISTDVLLGGAAVALGVGLAITFGKKRPAAVPSVYVQPLPPDHGLALSSP